MKDYIRIMAAIAVVLALIPLVGYAKRRSNDRLIGDTAAAQAEVSILFEESGEILGLSLHDYIVGAVFAQMPADFEDEALKAQAVLAATYARRRMLSEAQSPTDELSGATMSSDTMRYQAYFTPDQAKELYGADYEQAKRRISAAADFAEGLTLCYGDEPIIVAFHGISYGATESAFDMWGEDIPYLRSAESPWDTELDECRSSVSFIVSELRELLEGELGVTLGDDPEEWLSPAVTTSNGTVLRLRVGGSVFDSEQICDLLGLPSQHFTVTCGDGSLVFDALGCGHLVGMSQYGANAMAAQGADCAEILLHYFKGTQLVKDPQK